MKLTGENILSKIQDRLVLHKYIRPFTRENQNRKITEKNTICLFCQPRGGSTWLAEILLNIPQSVLIDEPLWRGKLKSPWKKPDQSDRKVPEVADLDFYFNQHIPESENWLQARNVFEDILAGRSASKGLYDEQDYSRLKNGGTYVTKFCYANLLMPWLVQQFDFEAILLTRHPCAVIASQLRHPSWQGIRMDKSIMLEDFPFSEIYKVSTEKIGRIDSLETYLALIWAMNFKQTAMHPDNNRNWLTVSYERLLLCFDSEIDRINQRLRLNLHPNLINREKPSKSTYPDTNDKVVTHAKHDEWQRKLTKSQISAILRVLDIFEIDIYNRNTEPDYQRLYANEVLL
jgi:hypothetical protein